MTTQEAPNFDGMSDRDVLIVVATNQHHMAVDIVEIKQEAKTLNGTVRDLVIGAAKQDGAMWILRGIMAVMTLGASITGVVVILVI